MESYPVIVRSLKSQFDECTIKQVLCSSNTQANALASLSSTSKPSIGRMIPVGYVKMPSIKSLIPERVTIATLIDADDQ